MYDVLKYNSIEVLSVALQCDDDTKSLRNAHTDDVEHVDYATLEALCKLAGTAMLGRPKINKMILETGNVCAPLRETILPATSSVPTASSTPSALSVPSASSVRSASPSASSSCCIPEEMVTFEDLDVSYDS